MATLSELDLRGDIHRLDPQLAAPTQEERVIYLSPRLAAWINDTLPGLAAAWNVEESPLEQLDQLVETFCSGKELAYEHQFHALDYKGGGMWELKTADLRIFGWFKHRDHFVAYVADSADRIKKHGLYHGYCGETERFRTELNLDDPKFIEGDDPYAVVSNYHFP